mmetsp:Transcript_70919/g.163964  ORF Transcript_70919/g.163964 Transcript_70919/m.163964 type:complete len:218 (+) Transcript_70919:66-719(+)
MEALDPMKMPASLAVIQMAGAASLDLPLGPSPSAASPPEPSPWACSTEPGSPPWSPVTPAVTGSFAGHTAGMSPTKTGKSTVSISPFFPSQGPLELRPHPARTFVKPQIAAPVRLPLAQPSPTNAGQVAMSPTSQIRHNAVSFGIPLNLNASVGEVVAPLPVRTTSGVLLAPSPTTRSIVAQAPASTAPVPTVSAPLVRSMATPFTGVQPRRAVGGA